MTTVLILACICGVCGIVGLAVVLYIECIADKQFDDLESDNRELRTKNNNLELLLGNALSQLSDFQALTTNHVSYEVSELPPSDSCEFQITEKK